MGFCITFSFTILPSVGTECCFDATAGNHNHTQTQKFYDIG